MPEIHNCYAITSAGTPCSREGYETLARVQGNVARNEVPLQYELGEWAQSRIYLCNQHANKLPKSINIRLPYLFTSREEMIAAFDNNKENTMPERCISCGDTTTGDHLMAIQGLQGHVVVMPGAPCHAICNLCYKAIGHNEKLMCSFMDVSTCTCPDNNKENIMEEVPNFTETELNLSYPEQLASGCFSSEFGTGPDWEPVTCSVCDAELSDDEDVCPKATLRCGKCKGLHHTVAEVKKCHQVGDGDRFEMGRNVRPISNPYNKKEETKVEGENVKCHAGCINGQKWVGAIVNGKPSGTMPCYCCGQKGYMTPADVIRDEAYHNLNDGGPEAASNTSKKVTEKLMRCAKKGCGVEVPASQYKAHYMGHNV